MNDPIVYRWEPTWLPSRARLFPLGGAIVSASAYTGTSRGTQLPKTPWVAEFTFPPGHEDQWVEIEAMIERLDGPSNYVRLFHPLRVLPRGVACGINRTSPPALIGFSDGLPFSEGTYFADGGTRATLARTHYRGEKFVKLQGLVPSQAQSIMTGDMMEIAGYLHRANTTVASDANGMATVPIRPPLRVDVPAGSPQNYVEFAYATSPFMLADSNFKGVDIEAPDLAELALSFVEVTP